MEVGRGGLNSRTIIPITSCWVELPTLPVGNPSLTMELTKNGIMMIQINQHAPPGAPFPEHLLNTFYVWSQTIISAILIVPRPQMILILPQLSPLLAGSWRLCLYQCLLLFSEVPGGAVDFLGAYTLLWELGTNYPWSGSEDYLMVSTTITSAVVTNN